jgi:hypothetical protein
MLQSSHIEAMALFHGLGTDELLEHARESLH